jgi:hypothetical protein
MANPEVTLGFESLAPVISNEQPPPAWRQEELNL